MKTWIALLVISLPLPAAADCSRWSAGMQEDEGGKVMTAQICDATGKVSRALLVTCGEPGKLSIRYLADDIGNVEPNYTTKLEFSFDQELFTEPAQYEEMDGALAAEVGIDTPFVSILKTQKQVLLADVKDKAPGATFTLKGSRPALDKLIATCRRK